MSHAIPGGRLAIASWGGTALLLCATVPALAATDELAWLSAVVAVPLFIGGAVAMLVAFFSAPSDVQRSFMTSLGLQAAVGLTGAVLRPYTALAFGILASLWGLGLAGMWGAHHGTFAKRAPGSEDAMAPPSETN